MIVNTKDLLNNLNKRKKEKTRKVNLNSRNTDVTPNKQTNKTNSLIINTVQNNTQGRQKIGTELIS